MKKVYTFYSKLSSDEFNLKVKELATKNDHEIGEFMYDKLEDGFALGIGRGGHGGGYWYDAKLSEECGILKIQGSIHYHENKSDRKKEVFGLVILGVFFFYLAIPLILIALSRRLFFKTSEEKQLENFMINIMECQTENAVGVC